MCKNWSNNLNVTGLDPWKKCWWKPATHNGAWGKKRRRSNFILALTEREPLETATTWSHCPCIQASHSSDTLVCSCLPQVHKAQHRGKAEKSTSPKTASVPETLAKLGYTRSSFKVQKGSLTTPHTGILETIPLLSNHRHSLKSWRNGLQLLSSRYSCFLSNKQWQETARSISIQINRCIGITGFSGLCLLRAHVVSVTMKSAEARSEL